MADAILNRTLQRKDAGGSEPTDRDMKTVAAELKSITDQVKKFAEDAHKEIKQAGELSAETKKSVDEALVKQAEIAARLGEVEQKLARRGGDARPEVKSLGQLVVEDESVKGLTGGTRGVARVRLDRKNITSAPTTVGAGVSGSTSLVVADRVPGVIAGPTRRLTIRDLLIPGETGSGSVEFVQEVGFTNAAAMVAEGAARPKSDITFDLKNLPVRTVAHIFKASRQILDDAPMLRSYIDGRARGGLQLKEEQQLLSGDGTGQNILGLMPQAAAFDPAITIAGATPIDRMRLALLQVTLSEYPASAFVLNPLDWAAIELTKDGEGRYIIASPQDGTTPRLWGLPVVETQAMALNNFLAGAFNMGAQIFDRQEIEVLISTENADDFERGMCTIRAEERLMLATYRPEAFVTGEVIDAP